MPEQTVVSAMQIKQCLAEGDCENGALIEKLRNLLKRAQPYVNKAADSFESDYAAMRLAGEIEDQFTFKHE